MKSLKEKVQQRYDICKECKHISADKIEKCKVCGCFILFKILPQNSKCPIGKW
jgi:hypothetical protein